MNTAAPHELARLLKLCREKGMNTQRLERALHAACQAYGSDLHWTGESLLSHVTGVLNTLVSFEPDEDAVISCLLHHVLQTRSWSLTRLQEEFGKDIRRLVSGVHLLSHVTTKGRRVSLDNLRSMLLRVSDDMRVVLAILCDRCYLLDHLSRLSHEEQRRVCTDVLHLFAPVAARLGIYALKHVLEGRAFPIVYPVDSELLQAQLKHLQDQHGFFLDEAARDLTCFLRREGVHAAVSGRRKEPFSAFTKMRLKSMSSLTDIADLFAFRVIVDTEEACYQTLGLLHRIGHPVSNRFKDYIAFPKPNGYRSLHTTLATLKGVPDGIVVEVQVRTEEMHRHAELGIAAHWRYKEGGHAEIALQRSQLQRMLAEQQPLVDDVRSSTFKDHIFVLTPKGDVVELPEGATPLDFAFAIHTDIGLSFRCAKVNGLISSIDVELQNGDVVEVLRSADAHPSSKWLRILKTSIARTRLRKYLVLREQLRPSQKGEEHPHREQPARTAPRSGKRSPQSVIEIEDGVPMPIRYAKCCLPEKQQGAIAGVITRTGTVKVHRSTCGCLKHVNPERRVGVRWRG